MLLLIYRTLDAMGELLEAGEDVDLDAEFSSWVYTDGNYEKIMTLLSWGIYAGGGVDPRDTYPRALMAQMLYNLLTK
jgi:hypothetical protein